MKKSIVISGTVGVGKTTLIEALQTELPNSKYFFEETVNTPYLKKYYEDIKKWSFLGQLSFLSTRYEQWLKSEEVKSEYSIFDRCILDDYVFFMTNVHQKNMLEEDQELYKEVLKKMIKIMKEDNNIPDYFFMLKTDKETIIKRMMQRGREDETTFDKEYFEILYNAYYDDQEVQTFLRENVKNFIEIDANQTVDQIKNEILKHIKGDE